MIELGPEGTNSISGVCWKKESASTNTEMVPAVPKLGNRMGKVRRRGGGIMVFMTGDRAANRKPWPKSPFKSAAEPGWGQGSRSRDEGRLQAVMRLSCLVGKHTLYRLRARWIFLILAHYFDKVLSCPCTFFKILLYFILAIGFEHWQ